MAEIGGMLAAGLLKVAAGKVAAAAGDRFMLQWRFDEDLEEMKETMESIDAVLQDAERRAIQDRSTELWLKRLTGASYDIADMFDEFDINTARKSALRKLKVLNPCLTLTSEIRRTGKMKKVRKKLEKISNDRDQFSFKTTGSSSSNVQQDTNNQRETWPSEVNTNILGREQEKQKVIDLLMEASISSESTVLPIYGIGGIGKTTLANLIYNDKQFKYFKKAWVFVSQTFNLKKIRDSISSELQKEQSQLAGTQEPDATVGKNFLIVLDDLWEKDDLHLHALELVLRDAGHECKMHVIVTTRDAEIAQKLQTTEAYKIELLPSDMCWDIIKQRIVDFESKPDKEMFEATGKEIAGKCGGVALAALALGKMLKYRDFNGWVAVKDSCLWKVPMPGHTRSEYDHVYACLKLSFSSMGPYLRLCFAYCAIFPKGHKMAKDDLIYQWAALGFMEPSPEVSVKEHGESYINQLLGMSFFQHWKSLLMSYYFIAYLYDCRNECFPLIELVSDGSHVEEVTFFTMHDLVHDLAMLIVGDEVLDPTKKGKTSNCRYASLSDCSKPLNSFLPDSDKIRALRLAGDYKVGQCADGFSIASYLRLRVLDLRESSIHKLPSSIGKLKQLRYLNAPGIQDRMIPSCITKLSKLVYLNLSGSVISALPELIGELEDLVYLNLSGCSEISELPESFGKLKSVVHLDLSNCTHVTGVSEVLENLTQLQYLNLSFCKNIGEVPEALGSLTKLQYLNLSCSSYFVGRSDCNVLGTLTNIEHLNLSSTEGFSLETLPETLGSFTKLKYLNLAGCKQLKKLPGSFGKLRNLVQLDLSESPLLILRDIPEALSSLTKLQCLNLSAHQLELSKIVDEQVLTGLPGMIEKLSELRYLNLAYRVDHIYKLLESDHMIGSFLDRISTLSNLEHLDLSGSGSINTIPNSLCSLRKLHTLNLTHCFNLRKLPENIVDMDSLKFLIVTNCWRLDVFNMRTNVGLIRLPHFVVRAVEGEQSSNLVLLKGVNPPELKISGLENVKSVQETHIIELKKKQSIVKLTLDWTGGKRHVEDLDLLSGLIPPRSLQEFEVRGYNSMSFPTWLLMDIASYLPNLTELRLKGLFQCSRLPPIGQLPNLEDLRLEAMPKITKIDGDFCGGEKAFAKVKTFSISNMESLEEWSVAWSSSEGFVVEFMFPSLEWLFINGCKKLKLKPRLPRVTEYWEIIDSDDVLFQWGESVPSTSSDLVELFVEPCKTPMHQWRLLLHLHVLDILTIENCNDLSYPSEMARALRSLRGLNLKSCHSMTSLPEWVGDLTDLRVLLIYNCSSIQTMPQLGDLVSLESLSIEKCSGIVSLPESIQQLTNLRKLRLFECPATRWCEDNEAKIGHIKHRDHGICSTTHLSRLVWAAASAMRGPASA
ncbi:hypothetical protein ACP4OV_022775 [Aristida adscensionis]